MRTLNEQEIEQVSGGGHRSPSSPDPDGQNQRGAWGGAGVGFDPLGTAAQAAWRGAAPC